MALSGSQVSQFGLGGFTQGLYGSFAGKSADVTAPVFVSASIPAAGTSITITYDEAVEFGAGGNTGFTISASGGASTLTYSSGSGTTSLVYSLSRTIDYGETVTLSYTNPGNGAEDAAGNDVGNLSSETVGNNSAVNQPESTVYAMVENMHNDLVNDIYRDLTG